MRVVFAAAIASLLACATYGQQSNWESFKPGTGTTADVFHLFGTPDYVQVEMEWREFVDFQASPRLVTAYSL